MAALEGGTEVGLGVQEGCGGHTLPLAQSAALCPPVFLVAWLGEVLLPY